MHIDFTHSELVELYEAIDTKFGRGGHTDPLWKKLRKALEESQKDTITGVRVVKDEEGDVVLRM
jgi:hypothetical protein